MADQATLNRNGGPRVAIDSPVTEGVFGNLTEFVNDCTTLAELQAKLAVQDLKVGAGKATVPVIGLVAGGALAIASLPVLLLGLGELIYFYGGLERHWAYLIVAGVALVLGGLLAWLLGTRFGPVLSSFDHSREELTRNLAWIKTVLAHSGRSPRHHRRVG
jgi:hypothetical protein